MQEKATDVPIEAQAALALARSVLAETLLAAYLHGSAVAGGLRPQSDVDLLMVVDQPLSLAARKALLAGLLEISGRHPASPAGPRCIELMIVEGSELAALRYPACCTFVYGEWLRDAFEAGEFPGEVCDPEITLVLAQARQEARALDGPAAADLFPVIPDADIRRAMRDGLPALTASLGGDERNVLLTLARMWRTAATGDFVGKDAAADWAMPRLPEPARAMLRLARDAYLGRTADDWSAHAAQARQATDHLHRKVAALLDR